MTTVKEITSNLGGLQEVKNMTSSRGNYVPNQFILHFEKGMVFQSYSSIIAVWTETQIYLTNEWDYSQTTGKYRNQFLEETKKETQEKIDLGIYKIIN